MKALVINNSLLLGVLLILFSCSTIDKDYTQYVNPFIGTDRAHLASQWRSEGSTFPGAVAPHGMVQISPETSSDKDFLQGYYYWHDTIRYFSLTEHFSGWPNGSAGKGCIMPFNLKNSPTSDFRNEMTSSFRHNQEIAAPGFYSVLLDNHNIRCSFAALTRSVIGEFQFASPSNAALFIGDYEHIEAMSSHELILVIKANRSKSFAPEQVVNLHFVFRESFEIQKMDDIALLLFPGLSDDGLLEFKYGASYVSRLNAKQNLLHEIPNWNIQMISDKAKKLWNNELRRIEVGHGNVSKMVVFYTALYHSLLLPVNATDINREYPGHEQNQPLEPDETHYIYFTPWDTFRTLHPLINFIDPEKGLDFIHSMLRYYRSYGRFPELKVMTGVHTSTLVLDAISQGIKDFDIELAYKGLSELILEKPFFRAEMEEYTKIGYVPYPGLYATTSTLEFAFNDWVMANIAGIIGDNQTQDSLLNRSFNYRNNYHPLEQFMRSRNRDGTWSEASLYAEADKWNASWFVPHNTRDLINLMGGDSAFCNHLNNNFEKNHFILDNENPLNFSFLFSYAGQPWKTMQWTHQIADQYFTDRPGGIPGNDDWGAMSSWYIWSAMGLYPSCPGSGEFILSSPFFDRIVIRRSLSEKLLIKTEKRNAEDIFIKSVKLNKESYQKPYILQKDLLGKKHLRIVLDDAPNLTWGIRPEDRPYSVTKNKPYFEILSLNADKSVISAADSLIIVLQIKNRGATGSTFVTLQNKESTIASKWVLLKKNEEKSISFPTALYHPGIQKISVDSHSSIILVEPNEQGKAQLIYETPVVEPMVHHSDHIKLSCCIKNSGSKDTVIQPTLLINDTIRKKLDEYYLKAGEMVTLTDRFWAEGFFGFNTLSVESSKKATFKVYNAPSETLVLYYTFDMDDTQIIDYSGFNNHGSVVGKLKYEKGVSGLGIRFTDGYIKVPMSLSLDVTGQNLTMVCWYKPENDLHRGCLITKGSRNMLKMNGPDQVRLAIGGWGYGECLYHAPIKSGTVDEPAWNYHWTHFAGIGKPGVLEIFVNGELTNTQPHSGKMKENDFEWRIGSSSEVPDSYSPAKPEGIIDEVMIFAGSLTQEEIQEMIKRFPATDLMN